MCTPRTHKHRTILTYLILKFAVRTRTLNIVLQVRWTRGVQHYLYLKCVALRKLFCICFGATIDCYIFFNFELFNFLNPFRIKKLIKDLWHLFQITPVRSSPPEFFLWKDFMKICCKFTGEHPCQSVISTVEITLWYGCSPVNLLQLHIFRTHF